MFLFKTVDLDALAELPSDLVEEISCRLWAENKVRDDQRKKDEQKAKRQRARRGRR